MENLIDIRDLSVEEIQELVTVALDIAANPAKYSEKCRGKKLATLFFEPSTRTRLSFEAAMYELGGNVLGFTTPQECFRKLLASRGAGRLDEAIDFLVKGCGLDLQSPSPSQSPEELRRILLDLQCVQVLKTTYDKLGVLAGKMPKQFGETSLLDGEALTGRLMDLTEAPFVSADDVGGLVKGCGFSQPAANVYFMTDLLNIVRTLSPRLFPEESDRFKLVDACQGHLDALVEKIEDNG